MNSYCSRVALVAGIVIGGATAASASSLPPETSLNYCQNAVKTATAQFISKKVAAVGGCLRAISAQVVRSNAPDASRAAPACVTQFRRLNDSRGLGKSLGDKLNTAIVKKCDPLQPGVTHTLPDILGAGAGVAQPLEATDLNAWCAHFGGDGSIDSLQEWRDCIAAAAECGVDAAIAAQYPRALEWLALVRPFMLVLPTPSGDPNKSSDAVAGLDAVKAGIDGPDNDNVVSVQCGGVQPSGTATVGDVLAGKTFSNGTAGGLTGTMPNRGAVTLMPGTTNQAIAAGYHNGSGYCAGDTDLATGNIRSGVTLFGVVGSSTVVETSGTTATAADMASGKTAFVNGSLVTGSAPAGSNVNGPDGATTFTIPDGIYSGSKTATASDSNLTSVNIKSGVTIFGVTGIFAPPTCGNGAIDGSEECDQGNLNGETCVTQGFAGGSLACGPGCILDTSGCYAVRFVDNADGTITDNQTALQWEKKVKLNGTTDFANLQDADNSYPWAGTCTVVTSKYCQPTAAAATACAAGVEGNATGCAECTGGDGTCSATTTVWTWLVALNAATFGTHNDWRLPKRTEVESILDLADTSSPIVNVAFHGASCGVGCTDVTSAACSCTPSTFAWSSTTAAVVPPGAWNVDFQYGYAGFDSKTTSYRVRAVRGGV